MVFRSIDHLANFIAVGEYAMADQVISHQLLSIIARNKLTRALYRMMEVEVGIQRYLKEKRGYPTPQIRLPEDVEALADAGPVQIVQEEDAAGTPRPYLVLHLPDIPILRDIVLRLVDDIGLIHDVRLDAVGSAPLDLPPGTYAMGLVYEPPA
jgi:hypothetical protein